MVNIVVSKNQDKAEKYCAKNKLEIGNTFIKMFFDYYESICKGYRGDKLIIHDLDNKVKFELNHFNVLK